jgi:DNA-binding response OmpR family regulator
MCVLVAVDDGIVRDFVTTVLEREGLEVVAVRDGNAALAAIEARARAFDLIVTDPDIPGTDGLALLERARRHHPGQRGILLAACMRPEEYRRARSLTAHVFEKPFSVAAFLAVVRGFGGKEA